MHGECNHFFPLKTYMVILDWKLDKVFHHFIASEIGIDYGWIALKDLHAKVGLFEIFISNE